MSNLGYINLLGWVSEMGKNPVVLPTEQGIDDNYVP